MVATVRGAEFDVAGDEFVGQSVDSKLGDGAYDDTYEAWSYVEAEELQEDPGALKAAFVQLAKDRGLPIPNE